MDMMQALWGINSMLLVILGFFIKMWIAGIKEEIKSIHEELEKKASVTICEKIHAGINKMLHKHATTGTAGEVVVMGGDR